MDRNGYNPSIVQQGQYCYLCGRRDRKLDRHEIYGGAYRQKSKRLGLWVLLCHNECHLNGVHANAAKANCLKADGEAAALKEYGWAVEDFIQEFGKNYIITED